MVLSFYIYLTLCVVMYLFGLLAYNKECLNSYFNKESKFISIELVIIFIFFSFISGIRWNVGIDHQNYLFGYELIQNGSYSIFEKEVGFDVFTKFFAKKIDAHFSIYFGVLAFIQVFFLYYALRHQKIIYPIIGLVLVLGPHYLSWMNLIRQMIVATIFICLVPLIANRKVLSYLFIVCLLSLVHKSALILSIFFFIPNTKILLNKLLAISLIIITFAIGQTDIWVSLLSNINPILGFIGYDHYAGALDYFISEIDVQNVGPRAIGIILSMIMLAWYGERIITYFKNPLLLYYYNFAIIGICLHNVLVNMHHVFLRPILYLTIFSLPMISYLICYLIRNSSKKVIALALVVIFSLTYLPLSIISDYGKGARDYTNYNFYWDYSD
ncbi:EpsG family protein [Vibrio breoganii]